MTDRPKCKLCGLEDGACICAHLPPRSSAATEQALPCPFCGQQPEINESGWAATIHCANEDCDVGCETASRLRSEAIEAWNRRIIGAAQGSSEPCCPFCGRDPFHYVDIGVGMEPAAVVCCDLGDLYFRGAREAPEEVTMSWEDFTEIGSRLAAQLPTAPVETTLRDALVAAQVALADGGIESTPFTRDALERINEALAVVNAAPVRCSSAASAQWPEPKVTNPDIANPTSVPYLNCLIHRVLDAQQDINFAANEGANQSLCDAAALLDEVETVLRRAAGVIAQPQGVWQPIETAPRDGTPIEVCNTRHPTHPPVIVRWDNDHAEPQWGPHWCDAATQAGEALYYNQNYFDFWKPTTPLPRPHQRGGE